MPYCENYHNMKGLVCQPIILLISMIKSAYEIRQPGAWRINVEFRLQGAL